MTKRLQDAFAAASRLPDEVQDSLAEAILQEVADDQSWDRAFASSPETLERMAEEALLEHHAGLTKPWPA